MEKPNLIPPEQALHPDLEGRQAAFLRSVQVVDLVCDTATEFIRDFLEKEACPEAQALLAQPEILGIRAVEAALRHWLKGGRPSWQQLH